MQGSYDHTVYNCFYCLFVLFFQLRGLSQLCKSVSLNIIRLKSTARPTRQFKDTLINYCFVF